MKIPRKSHLYSFYGVSMKYLMVRKNMPVMLEALEIRQSMPEMCLVVKSAFELRWKIVPSHFIKSKAARWAKIWDYALFLTKISITAIFHVLFPFCAIFIFEVLEKKNFSRPIEVIFSFFDSLSMDSFLSFETLWAHFSSLHPPF